MPNDYVSVTIVPSIIFSEYFIGICTSTVVNGRTPCSVILSRLEEGTPEFSAKVFYIGTTSPTLGAGAIRIMAISHY